MSKTRTSIDFIRLLSLILDFPQYFVPSSEHYTEEWRVLIMELATAIRYYSSHMAWTWIGPADQVLIKSYPSLLLTSDLIFAQDCGIASECLTRMWHVERSSVERVFSARLIFAVEYFISKEDRIGYPIIQECLDEASTDAGSELESSEVDVEAVSATTEWMSCEEYAISNSQEQSADRNTLSVPPLDKSLNQVKRQDIW